MPYDKKKYDQIKHTKSESVLNAAFSINMRKNEIGNNASL